MAADEMRIITTDKWSDDVWGIASSSSSSSRNRDGEGNDLSTTAASLPARMFFYFGRNDHWVAEKTREEIIEAKSMARGKGGKTPTMVVCEDGLPHAFCLREYSPRLLISSSFSLLAVRLGGRLGANLDKCI